MEKEKIFKPTASIEYQKTSIVSHCILENSNGDVTLFAFDKNQRLSEHSTPFDAIVNIIEGEAEIIINKKSHFLKEGESIIMPANITHALHACEAFKMILIMIQG